MATSSAVNPAGFVSDHRTVHRCPARCAGSVLRSPVRRANHLYGPANGGVKVSVDDGRVRYSHRSHPHPSRKPILGQSKSQQLFQPSR